MLGQGTETATFKQLFANWKAPDAADPLKKVQTGGRLAKSISGKLISSIFSQNNIHFLIVCLPDDDTLGSPDANGFGGKTGALWCSYGVLLVIESHLQFSLRKT